MKLLTNIVKKRKLNETSKQPCRNKPLTLKSVGSANANHARPCLKLQGFESFSESVPLFVPPVTSSQTAITFPQVWLEVTYLHYSLPAPTVTVTVTAAAALFPKAVWITVDKPLPEARYKLALLVWRERDVCFCLLISPDAPLTPLQHLVWCNQSVPFPIHWTLSHSSIKHALSLSLPSLSLQCILVASPTELPPTLSFTLNIQHSLPLLLALSTSYIHSHQLCTISFLFFLAFSSFHLVPCIHCSLPAFSLFFSSCLGIMPSSSAIHFKSLRCLVMPTCSTLSLPTLLSLAHYL